MENDEMSVPPILVTGDVAFAVMKDGACICSDDVAEGPGWLEVGNAFAKLLDAIDDRQLLAIVMVDMMSVSPALEKRVLRIKRDIESMGDM